jgi:hypothetical protein
MQKIKADYSDVKISDVRLVKYTYIKNRQNAASRVEAIEVNHETHQDTDSGRTTDLAGRIALFE